MCTLRCSSPRPIHKHTHVHKVVRPLHGKEGDAQRHLSILTRELLMEEVRMAVAW